MENYKVSKDSVHPGIRAGHAEPPHASVDESTRNRLWYVNLKDLDREEQQRAREIAEQLVGRGYLAKDITYQGDVIGFGTLGERATFIHQARPELGPLRPLEQP